MTAMTHKEDRELPGRAAVAEPGMNGGGGGEGMDEGSTRGLGEGSTRGLDEGRTRGMDRSGSQGLESDSGRDGMPTVPGPCPGPGTTAFAEAATAAAEAAAAEHVAPNRGDGPLAQRPGADAPGEPAMEVSEAPRPTEASEGHQPSAAPEVPRPAAAARTWDDGLIARRAQDPSGACAEDHRMAVDSSSAAAAAIAGRDRAASRDWRRDGPDGYATGPSRRGYSRTLRRRLEALRELVGLSRTRLDGRTLAEAGRVLEEATARHRLSLDHTVVAIAGATGSGKSSLFNALAGGPISEAGVRRPTTSAPVACTWSDGADGLLDRLGVPPRLRRRPQRPYEPAMRGLVLLDLPDHDSAVTGHRDQVDRLLGLVDAVVWVLDPEKYADAVLHERYLQPLAGYAEVTFVVLNQTDRLPVDAAVQVLDDLRRLLDEDGMALGEHGEPGAAVLAVSALTGEGVGELREQLGRFGAERGAAERRLAADVTGATERLRQAYMADGRTGLTEPAREEYEARLADAVGAVAAGQAAEREWMRQADLACGGSWAQLRRWYGSRGRRRSERAPGGEAVAFAAAASGSGGPGREFAPKAARAMVEQAVRTVADHAAAGLPQAWALAVREAAMRGARELPEALERATASVSGGPATGIRRPSRPGWWTAAALAQGLLLVLQVAGALWLVISVVDGPGDGWLRPAAAMAAGVVGGPLLAWGCRSAARGPAWRYGQEVERRLRSAAAACGRSRALEPIAAELLRYQEVRDQYLVAAGGPTDS